MNGRMNECNDPGGSAQCFSVWKFCIHLFFNTCQYILFCCFQKEKKNQFKFDQVHYYKIGPKCLGMEAIWNRGWHEDC